MKRVKFIVNSPPYNAGEIAGFPPHDADRLVLKQKVAVYVDAADAPRDVSVLIENLNLHSDAGSEASPLMSEEELSTAAAKAEQEEAAKAGQEREELLSSLDSMNKNDLIEFADKKLNLELHPALKKNEMIEAIKLELEEQVLHTEEQD